MIQAPRTRSLDRLALILAFCLLLIPAALALSLGVWCGAECGWMLVIAQFLLSFVLLIGFLVLNRRWRLRLRQIYQQARELPSSSEWREEQARNLLLQEEINKLQGQLQALQHESQNSALQLQEAQAQRSRAQQANLAKTAFLTSMSHDIRIPLTGVLGMTDMLLGTELDAQQREFAGVIQDSGQALMQLVDGILDFSNIEAGQLKLHQDSFSPLILIEGVIDLLAPRASEKGLSLCCAIDPELPPYVSGDAGRIRQIIMNLASNALQYTQAGFVQLSAYVLGLQEGAVNIRFCVQDSGPGLSEAAAQQILQMPGQTLPQVEAERQPGLGLQICLRLAELMGARLGIESQAGNGAMFWLEICLPQSAAPDSAEAQPLLWAGLTQQVQARLQDASVLLVHDHEQESAAMCAILRSAGCRVLHAKQALNALEISQGRDDIALVIIGLNLPDMAGNALALALSTIRPQLRQILLASPFDLRAAASLPHFESFHAPLALPVKPRSLLQAALLAFGISSHPPLQAHSAPPAAPAEQPGAPHLLLVEDNEINQKLALILLRKMGFEVSLAQHGEQALQLWREGGIDLILMDCEMPVMDGFAATAAIRSQEAPGARIPIVAMTANALAGDRERCLAAGMDDYVSKPIQPEALLQAVKRHLPEPDVSAPRNLAAEEAAAVVDLTLLTDICGDDIETIFAFLDQYLVSTVKLLNDMGQSILHADWPRLRALNHELTGTSANLGVRLIHALTNGMSQACRDEDSTRASAIQQQMLLALDDVRIFVRNRG
ncbi:response regulator [Massilia sp. W12]|uniref:response regulator n=1 Tax=Massilia sp. W12 TaxID=3126507 RepID=UPI0030CBE152